MLYIFTRWLLFITKAQSVAFTHTRHPLIIYLFFFTSFLFRLYTGSAPTNVWRKEKTALVWFRGFLTNVRVSTDDGHPQFFKKHVQNPFRVDAGGKDKLCISFEIFFIWSCVRLREAFFSGYVFFWWNTLRTCQFIFYTYETWEFILTIRFVFFHYFICESYYVFDLRR